MKKKLRKTICIFSASIVLAACGEKKNDEAIAYLDNIHTLYNNGDYEEALSMSDSLQILYPKAFKEIKEGLTLKQDIRRALNQRYITDCDSLLSVYEPKIDSLKKLFILQKDKNYQEVGVYIPKITNTNSLTGTTLRSGVYEDGRLYLESVYLGGQLHNKVKIATRDKNSAESLPVNDDGLNFRFSNLGQQYEVIKVMPIHNNGLVEFICTYADQSLTVTLDGKSKTSFALSNAQKKAITDSYQLSTWILQQDSLMTAKDKAETLIRYLDSKNTASDEQIKTE